MSRTYTHSTQHTKQMCNASVRLECSSCESDAHPSPINRCNRIHNFQFWHLAQCIHRCSRQWVLMRSENCREMTHWRKSADSIGPLAHTFTYIFIVPFGPKLVFITSWSPFDAEILMASACAARANSAFGFNKLIEAISTQTCIKWTYLANGKVRDGNNSHATSAQ